MDDCPHGSDPLTCRVCRPAPPTAPVTLEYEFKAKFDGQCPGCNLPIVTGQGVGKWSDGRTRHAMCTP